MKSRHLILRILSINIISIMFIFIIFEAHFANELNVKPQKYFYLLNNSISVEKYFNALFSKEQIEGTYNKSFRKDLNTESKKPPILFMGDSFTYGLGIKEEDTISSQFARLTQRPTYNRAGCGWSPAQFLYMSKQPQFYSQIKEPEYLIYTFVNEHYYRLKKFKVSAEFIEFQPKYKFKNNTLIEIKPKFYDYLFLVQKFNEQLPYIYKQAEEKEMKAYFEEAEKEIHKHWKNTKLVILLYENTQDNTIWEELSKDYIIINANELTKTNLEEREYKVINDWWHPNAKAWETIVPALIDRLN